MLQPLLLLPPSLFQINKSTPSKMAVLKLSVDFRSRHSLSAGKNYEKAQVPAFSKTEFFLGRQVSLLESNALRSNQQALKINIGLYNSLYRS